jgi:hypothetical protein
MMDDDFDGGSSRGASPLFMFRMMESFLLPVLAIGILSPLALYVIARWRDQREPALDPHLGAKFALGFFKWQGYQVALAGVGVLLWSITTKASGEMREQIYRPAFGALIPGLLVFGVTAWALSRTNERERPQVGRLLAGYNLMITGVIGFVFLILAFQTLFAKGESGDPGRLIWSFAVVYVGAWIVQTAFFLSDLGVGMGGTEPDPPRPGSPLT